MRNRHPAGAWKVSRTDGVAGTRCCPEESLTLFSKQTNRCFCWARPPPGDICKSCKMLPRFSLHIPPLCSQWDILECEFSLDEKEVINSVLCIWEDRPGWNKAGKAGTDGGSGEVLDRL